MESKVLSNYSFIGFILFFISCQSSKKITLNYVDSYEIPSNTFFQNTLVGGISGIDYDRENRAYYLVSDDRSKHHSARFYKAKINLSTDKINRVLFEAVFPVSNGKNYFYDTETIDMESIRLNPKQQVLMIGDEGGEKGEAGIYFFDLGGKYQQKLLMETVYQSNLRSNKSFESICFSKDYRSLFYSTEAPLKKDGEEATLNNRGLLRIIESELKSGIIKQEMTYWLEKVPQKAAIQPPWKGTGSDNGLSELLLIDTDLMLTIERSGAYQVDSSFTYVSKVFSVKKGKQVKKNIKRYNSKKQLLFNFSSLPFKTYNIEGMVLGPKIKGQQTLLFVSDNNFKEVPSVLYYFTINY